MSQSENSEWREVSQNEFYAHIGPLDGHPHIQPGQYPYTQHMLTRDRRCVGKRVVYYPDGSRIAAHRFYLPK